MDSYLYAMPPPALLLHATCAPACLPRPPPLLLPCYLGAPTYLPRQHALYPYTPWCTAAPVLHLPAPACHPVCHLPACPAPTCLPLPPATCPPRLHWTVAFCLPVPPAAVHTPCCLPTTCHLPALHFVVVDGRDGLHLPARLVLPPACRLPFLPPPCRPPPQRTVLPACTQLHPPAGCLPACHPPLAVDGCRLPACHPRTPYLTPAGGGYLPTTAHHTVHTTHPPLPPPAPPHTPHLHLPTMPHPAPGQVTPHLPGLRYCGYCLLHACMLPTGPRLPHRRLPPPRYTCPRTHAPPPHAAFCSACTRVLPCLHTLRTPRLAHCSTHRWLRVTHTHACPACAAPRTHAHHCGCLYPPRYAVGRYPACCRRRACTPRRLVLPAALHGQDTRMPLLPPLPTPPPRTPPCHALRAPLPAPPPPCCARMPALPPMVFTCWMRCLRATTRFCRAALYPALYHTTRATLDTGLRVLPAWFTMQLVG